MGPSPITIFTARVPPYCGCTSPRIFWEASSPACRFPGASTKETRIWAAITWSGRATLVETACGFLAAGAASDALRVLRYLEATQEGDGHWPQNMWLDGRPYWNGLQMDEAAFPILLIDLLRREVAPNWAISTAGGIWSVNAAGFLVRNGPVTQQDRWEEDAGYSPFTLAVEIAALLAAADLADAVGQAEMARSTLRETADLWNDNIERWVYATNTRSGKTDRGGRLLRPHRPSRKRHRPFSDQGLRAHQESPPGRKWSGGHALVSPDALALVRFGLRSPDDPRILNTVKVIDALLRVQAAPGLLLVSLQRGRIRRTQRRIALSTEPAIGRAWPLLTGERAHFELAAAGLTRRRNCCTRSKGRPGASACCPSSCGISPTFPGRSCFAGSHPARRVLWCGRTRNTSSCAARCVTEGFSTSRPQTTARYIEGKTTSRYFGWRFNNKTRSLPAGKRLRIAVLAPAVVHWSFDHWQHTEDTETRDTGLGVFAADLPSHELPAGSQILFTFFWTQGLRWEGEDFRLLVENP
jgi:glucoamylase